MEGIHSLFLCRPCIRHDLQEVSGSFFRAEATGDLGLHLDHAKIAFSLIVVKRNYEVLHKQAYRLLLVAQSVNQGKNLPAFWPPASA